MNAPAIAALALGVWLAPAALAEATAAPTVTLSPADLEFPTIPPGSQTTLVLTVTANDGPVSYGSVEASPAAWFAVGADGCAADPVIPPGGSCQIEVVFTPPEAGPFQGTVTVFSDAPLVTAALGGEAVEPPPTSSSSSIPPTSTTAAPSTTTTTQPESRDECDTRARYAEVVYQPTREMRVDDEEQVAVVATTGGSPVTSLPGNGSTTVVPQPLRCQVRARLVGNDFTISPSDWTTKSFEGQPQVRWLWSVTPNEAGDDLTLILEVQGLRFDEDAGAYVEAGEAFETTATIEVSSAPKGLASRVNDAVSGVAGHPVVVLLAGTGALALAARWLIGRTRQGGSPA